MKIRLIDPALRAPGQQHHTNKEVKSFWFSHLSLTMLAGLTPEEHLVSITDENVDEIDFEENVDLVGLTGMTIHAPRAYEIAKEFRARGIRVVMGGIHASNLPREAKEHVDSVVIGEAEAVWGTVLRDLQGGALKPFYKADALCSLSGLPHPRQKLLKKKAYLTTNCVQTTRGCPFGCSFCSVTEFFGRRYRVRPVKEVVREVEQYAGDFVAFVDDNIVGNPRYAKELFGALIPLNIRWGSQASLTMAKDDELLALARKSGCIAMFVGIESLSQKNLSMMNKSFNRVEEYSEALRKFHDQGIMVNASLMFGLDDDDESVFEKTVRFVENNRIELITYNILTPLPGTKLFAQMVKENRIIDWDWTKYNSGNVVFKPRLMTEETLQNGYYWVAKKTYSYRSILKRLGFAKKNFVSRFSLNLGYRGLAQQVPKGHLSSIAAYLGDLNTSLPIKELNRLIPTDRVSSKERFRRMVAEAEAFLYIRTIKNDRTRTVTINLEGALDTKAARELVKRIKRIISKGQEKIVLDFSEIRYFSPKAINALFLANYDFLMRIRGRISFVRVNERIVGMAANVASFIFDGDVISDQLPT
ncbi:MAG: radical SAM protein [Deltaproteobacteria bacterium]|nr:radical SAM protein [Deltaproteobacteria bacterium]